MDYLHHIRNETARFHDCAAAGELSSPVRSCPGWTVGDLVGHLGTVQSHHGAHVMRGVTDLPTAARPTPPAQDVVDWGRQCLDQLLENLQAVGTDVPAWTFLDLPEPVTTAFWFRRMATEAAIHRWDVENTRGLVTAFDHDLALDGIDEVVGTFVPGKRRQGDREGTIEVRLTDDDRTWTYTHGNPDAARATISGPADQVWLRLWGRVPLDAVDVEGDRDLAASLSAG